jgi:hypothetical protein
MFPATYLPRLIPSVRAVDPAPPWTVPATLSWAGMRGAVTLAAAFVLPADTPLRPVLILAAFVVTAGTLLVQGTTLPMLVRVLHLRGPSRAEDALQQANVLQLATDAGLRELEELRAEEQLDETTVKRLHTRSVERANAAWERLGPSEADLSTPSDTYRRHRLRILQAERAEILRARDEGRFDHEVLQTVLATLDLEESMIDRINDAEDAIQQEQLEANFGNAPCQHLIDAPVTQRPDTPGSCSECVAEDLTWVHLRMCLTCGHVGCCDSSVGKHADKHYAATGHPVMRSVEPGEAWRWCYVDSELG